MAYGVEHPLAASRHIDVPSVGGFVASSAEFTALVVELAVRGWLGFATSRVELLIVFGWLGASGWLSWWAYTWAEGWSKALAALGVGLSGVGLVVVVALFAFRMLVEFPNLLAGDSKQQRKNSRNRRRRRSW